MKPRFAYRAQRRWSLLWVMGVSRRWLDHHCTEKATIHSFRCSDNGFAPVHGCTPDSGSQMECSTHGSSRARRRNHRRSPTPTSNPTAPGPFANIRHGQNTRAPATSNRPRASCAHVRDSKIKSWRVTEVESRRGAVAWLRPSLSVLFASLARAPKCRNRRTQSLRPQTFARTRPHWPESFRPANPTRYFSRRCVSRSGCSEPSSAL